MNSYYDISKVNPYLYFGYLPSSSSSKDLTKLKLDKTYSHTPEEAASILDDILDEFLDESLFKGNCIVPISGGWDSRILLGAAIERIGKDRIRTVSFGNPGQLDYDIGKAIASAFGVKHYSLELYDIKVSWEKVLNSVEKAPWSYVPDGLFNQIALSKVIESKDDIVLSGFMGDPLTGGHFSKCVELDDCIHEFLDKQKKSKSFKLTHSEYKPINEFLGIKEVDCFKNSELLDFTIRQSNCIAPIVTPKKKWTEWNPYMGRINDNSAKVYAPFVAKKWAEFWLSVPAFRKKNQSLYLAMMKYKFPKLSTFPSKYSLGKTTKLGYFIANSMKRIEIGLNQFFPKLGIKYTAGLNYIDFCNAFRSRDDYKMLLRDSFEFLEKNKITPWLDLEFIKNSHINFKSDYSEEILLLIGLAVNLKKELKI